MGSSQLIRVSFGKHVLRDGARPWSWLHALRLRALLVIVAWLCSVSVAAAVEPPTMVVLSGTAAPAGGNYASFSANGPIINNSGQIAFQANLSGGSASTGLFLRTSALVQSVALRGTAAPSGGNYNTFNFPVLNDNGQLAFLSSLTGGSSTQGFFTGLPGSLQTVGLINGNAPAGGKFNNFNAPNLNTSGQVAFVSNLTGGSADYGIFVGVPSALQTAALEGTPAPAGGNYSSMDSPMLNDAGQIVFPASLTGGTATRGIFVGTPGALQAAALQGTAAPAGGNFESFNTTAINSSGQITLVTTLTGGTSTRGMFTGNAGSLQTVALENTPAPAGGNFSSFNNPAMNDAGQIAFLGLLTGGSATRGIFIGAPGSLQAAAVGGDSAPGGGSYSSFGNPTLNELGQLAFVADLSGPGITSANDTALFAGLPGGLVQIVREGDLIDVDPGVAMDFRTVSAAGVNFDIPDSKNGRGITFNDSGMLVYSLTFTDGSSGVFTSVVPEPGTLGILAAGGFVCWLCRRRLTR